MARVNVGSSVLTERTHEGAPVRAITSEQELRRTVMACLLWESEFYESGKSIADRISALVPKVKPEAVAAMAVEARSAMHLRHVPLLLVREMARHVSHRPHVRATLAAVIQRADELSEFLAIYWKDKKQPLANSVKRGLADAFQKFSAYSLAKYNRDAPVKLRDALFLSHAKPKDGRAHFDRVARKAEQAVELREQEAVWKQLVDGTLPAPDTWEVALSASKGEAKRETWERLLAEQRLGGFALIRNLRNMIEAKVNDTAIRSALLAMKPDRILPFRFLAAVRHAPRFAAELEAAMLKNLEGQLELTGHTVLLLDMSGSMDHPLSAKSEIQRTDAAAGLAVLARELCASCRILTFSDRTVEVPAYRGLGLVDAVLRSQPASGTYCGKAVSQANADGYDRVIVITDGQSHDPVPGPKTRGYMVNIASNRTGVGYGPWHQIDGWSDRVFDYIRAVESAE